MVTDLRPPWALSGLVVLVWKLVSGALVPLEVGVLGLLEVGALVPLEVGVWGLVVVGVLELVVAGALGVVGV